MQPPFGSSFVSKPLAQRLNASPRTALRGQRAEISKDLAQNLAQQREDQATHRDDAILLQSIIADDQASLARIDARLRQFRAAQ